MYSALLLSCLVLMTALFKERCLRSGKVHINPIFGLLVGISFYVLLPCSVIAYFSNSLANITVYEDYLTLRNATNVMAFTFVLLIALWVGTRIAKPKASHPKRFRGLHAVPHQIVGSNAAAYLMFGSYALFLALAFSIRGFLFSGYDLSALQDDSVWSARGAMSSCYSLIYVSICATVLRSRSRLPTAMIWTMTLIFLSASVTLLSIGARLYVAMALLSMLALHSLLRGGIPATRLLFYLLAAVGAFGSIGVLRSASLTGLGSVLLNVALEPLLTSISLFTLLTDNSTILIGKFYLFPADFQAIIPSFLFPAKAALFDRLNDYGYVFEAPVGGYHLYFSALINFGLLGSVLLAVPCGYALARLSPNTRSLKRSTALTSIFLTGALAFTLFRDPFFISVVKNVFVMAILVPILITSITLYGRNKVRLRDAALGELV